MVTVSLDGLDAFARTFWRQAGSTKVFLFYGEMGAGKTTLIEAICAAKGVKERMGSPTFSIINQYGYSENGREGLIYHIDLYRLKDEEEIIQAGVEDCVYSGAVCMVEWPQKAPGLFDNNVAEIFIEPIGETQRNIKIVWPQGSVKEQL
ncbi:MAG TPA: tRNA (adenosine(37)-N6)-threonylcarbamoyltransferase complex ATPase subunit type 1 TsaE [Flavisolibacter sp.]|nr:tRNA (adenosine(37)-N6)-threonylcarbamoyltransferase complex ATPase subunit type 1 TsaE [Flavisolibacter sp.]